MKNIVKISIATLFVAFATMGFSSKLTKKYGGTASVTITTYKAKFDGSKFVKGEKIGNETAEAEADCMYADEVAAKKALKTELEGTRLTKNEYGKVIAEFTAAVAYSISTCEK
jgi:hypothetical protein